MSTSGNELVKYLLGHLEKVRPTHSGWIARCPAHPDRSPSLSVRVGERAILIKCFAGCPIEDICDAIGLEVRKLFFDSSKSYHRPPGSLKLCHRSHWRTTATRLEQHALSLHLRSESVLEAAKSLDTENWGAADLQCAMEAVSRAYCDADRAAMLEEVAYSLRAKRIEAERQSYESRCRAIKSSR